MEKETYHINVYKLDNIENLDDFLRDLKQKIYKFKKKEKSNCIIEFNENTKILYYSYLNENFDNDINWFEKWKYFFEIDEQLRGASSTGHGIIIVELMDKKAFYVFVFGRAYSMIKDYVIPDYGITLGERLFDGSSMESVVSKYVSLTKNKSVVSYANGTNYVFEEGEVADGVKAKIKTPLTGDDEIKQLLELVRKNAEMCYSNIKFVVEHENINLSLLINIVRLLNNIEEKSRIQFSFPRMKPVQKEMEHVLNEQLLKQIREKNNSIIFSIPYFGKDSSNEYAFLESITEIKVNYKKEYKVFEEVNVDKICDFINNILDIDDISKIKCFVTNVDGYEEKDTILKWLETEVELDGKTYVLNNGKWYLFNDEYTKRIQEKIKEIEQEKDLIVCDDTFSASQLEINNLIEENEEEVLKLFTTSETTKIKDVYSEYRYNYYIHKNKNYRIFDRAFGSDIEICDLQDENNAFIHTKIGKSSDLETCLRQSILGVKKFYDAKNDILGFENKIGETLEEPKTIKVLYLRTSDKPFKLSEIKSLKFKLTFLDWYKSCKLMKYNPQIIVARYIKNDTNSAEGGELDG